MKSGTCIPMATVLNFTFMPGCKVFIVQGEDGLEDTYSPDVFFEKFKIVSQVLDFKKMFEDHATH